MTDGIYSTEQDRVEEFSSTGTFKKQFGSKGSGNGQFKVPDAVAVDAHGHVWVMDSWNARVEKFELHGEEIEYKAQFGSKGTGNGEFEYPDGSRDRHERPRLGRR